MDSFRSDLSLTVCSLLTRSAKNWPERCALDNSARFLTYGELDAQSDQLSRVLAKHGVRTGDSVAVVAGRSIETIVALAAILKVGADYLPLDPGLPLDNLLFTLRDARPTLVMLGPNAKAFEGFTCIELETALAAAAAEPAFPIGVVVAPSDPAYIMFTSGTTGQPKGVIVPHRAIVRLVRGADFMTLSADTVMLHAAPLAFDASTLEIWGPLLNGGRVAILSDAVPSIDSIATAIRDQGVNTAWFTAGLFHLMVDQRPNALLTLTQLLAGGDVLSPSHVRKALALLPNCRLINGYGPTENTTFTCCYTIPHQGWGGDALPIGHAIAGTTVHILSNDFSPVADGEEGQLCVGGAGVALGYLNRPELTAEKFVADPFSAEPDAKLYLTGDYAKRRSDGVIEFLGRRDRQVKINGVRIELDGIEQALREDDRVVDAAVALTDGSVKKIIAFLKALTTLSPQDHPPHVLAAAVLADLKTRLPPQMVPSSAIVVADLPLNANGKIDRARLLREHVNPTAATKAGGQKSLVAEIWSSILDAPIDTRTNLFDLGATSLQMISAHERIQVATGQRFAVTELFAHPSVAEFEAFLARGQDPSDRVSCGRKAGPAIARGKAQVMPSQELAGFAIVGMSGRFPGAKTVDEFWDNLLKGRASIKHFSSAELEDVFDDATRADPDFVRARPIIDDVEMFDADYFNIPPREAALTDPQQRLFLEICVEALEDAGHDPQRYERPIGVFAGSSMNTYFLRHVCSDYAAIEHFTSDFQVGSYSELLGTLQDFIATRVAYKLNLRGPAVAVQSACSTSLLAVAQACQSLATFQCDMALAGGVSITFPQKRGYLYQDGGIASRDGTCRPFDASAAGTVFGSGAGVVLIKRLADAITDGDDIYAVIKGYGVNNDGTGKVGFTAPGVRGQAECISSALAMAEFTAESIGYVECHGTATPLGDPIEIEGLTQGFSAMASGDLAARSQPCLLGSVKANVGHLDAAAGVTGLIKTALILHRGVIPPQINFDEPNPRLDLKRGAFALSASGTAWTAGTTPRRAGVSAFGVGGTNVHISLEEAPPLPTSGADAASQPLVIRLSARSQTALAAMPARLADALESASVARMTPSLASVAHTLRNGRRELEHRSAIAASSVSEAITKLRALRVDSAPAATTPRAVFMFPGQGAQYPGMGRALYESDPLFRADVDAGAAVIEAHLGQDIRKVLFDDQGIGEEAAHPIRSTTLAQPALFLIEYALAQKLIRLGVEPVALIGHSLGELVAAALAKVMSYEDALRLVVHRGRIMNAQPPGAMLSVRMPAAELRKLLPPGAEIASENAPLLSVASGPFDALSALEARLTAAGIGHRRLHTSHAFHSEMMEPVVEELKQVAASLHLRPPQCQLMSTVTGRWLTDAEATSPSYWAQQCREMVSFREAVGTLMHEVGDNSVLIEVGPGRALSTFAEASEARDKVREVVSTAPDFADRSEEAGFFAEAIGALWCHGFAIKDAAVHGTLRAHLPAYPFQRTRCWIERPATEPAIGAPPRIVSAILAKNSNNNEQSVAQAHSKESAVSEALLASLKTILSEISGTSLTEADHATSFLSLGFDSLLLGQVAQRVNKTFGIKITFRQLMRDLNTLEALAAMVQGAAPASKLPAAPAVKLPAAPEIVPVGPTPPAIPVAGVATATEPGLQALMRDQLQVMERLFVAQIAAAGGAGSANHAAAPAALSPAATTAVSSEPAIEILMPDTGADTPSRFRVYKPAGTGGDTTMEPRTRRYLDALISRYNSKTASSKARAQASRRTLADPRSASGFNTAWKEIVYPLVCTRSKGASIWDADGNEYIDLVNGYGQTMFGHAPDFVLDALRAQLDEGFAIGPQTALAGEVAARVSALTGNERVAFCNTGSEAVMAAMRVARAVTGREKVVMFEGAYHGQFDEVLIKPRRAGSPVGALPIAPGIPGDNVDQMIVLPYGHPQSLDIVRRLADDIAAVIVEPVQSRHPELQPREFLSELRDITAKSGSALVFDEVVTGFRVHPGGMQHVFGIRADLATYGKVLGGGMPIGVVAGCARFMDALDGGFWQYGDNSEPEVAPTFFAGTFVRHPLVLAAARAVLDHIETNQDEIYSPLAARNAELVARINACFTRRGLPTQAQHFASWFYLDVSHHGPLASLLYPELRLAGIHVHEGFPCFLTTAHTTAHCQAIGDAFERALDAMDEAGIITGPTGMAAIPQTSSDGVITVPLTEPQMEIFLAAQMGDAASMAFNESLTVRFEGPFDSNAMVDAVKAVVQRHDALRGRVGKEGDILEILSNFSIEISLLDFSGPDADSRLAALMAQDARSPFDLFGPLVRASIVKLAPEIHVLLFTAHHIVCDGWSFNIVLQDLSTLYNASRAGRPASLAPAASFANYAQKQNRQSTPGVMAFWKGLYPEIPEPTELPLDRPRPLVKSFAGASLRESLGEALCEEVRGLARRRGVSLFNVLFAAVQVVFARLSRNDNVVLTVPMGGQALLDDQDLVGHCVNFLPVPVRISLAKPFADHVAAVEARLGEVLDHQDYTLGSLVRDLAVPRSPDRTPLSDIQFNLERVGSGLAFDGLTSVVRTNPKAFVNFDLFLNLIESERDIAVEVDYATDLIEAATISRWIGHLRAVLTAAAQNPMISVAELPMFDSAVSQELIEAATGTVQRQEGMLLEAFERWCDATPDAVAIEFANERLSYREAEERSNRLAACIIELALPPGARIAVAIQRSIDLPVVMLAVAKAGHAFVPLDSALPEERVRQIVEAGAIAAFVTSGAVKAATETRLPILDLVRDASRIAAARSARILRSTTHTDPTAYVIFTSGSTGAPKGVEVGHTALTNFLASMAEQPGFTKSDSIVAVTTVSFDIALLELLLPLYCGGRTVIAASDTLADPAELVKLINSTGATVLQATPTLWRVLLEAGFKPAPGFKALCGGEPLPRDLASQLIATGVELWNMYGPTETTIWSSCGRVTDANRPIVIGAPIANTELHVLDDSGALAPIGVSGELCIGGQGLAKGYIGRPDLTERSFKIVSVEGSEPRRLYRTGDIAVRDAGGAIRLLGRRDQQVKVRGFRIELEEIEAALRSHPGVRDAAVAVEHANTPNVGLTAVVVAVGGVTVAPEALRRALSARLPPYMVPGRYIVQSDLPRTANGKLDRKALAAAMATPAPPQPAPAAAPSTVKDDATLAKIIALVEAVLGVQGVQPSDRIFSLGATSLHVFRMRARFNEAGLPLKPQHLMINPSIAELAIRAAALTSSEPRNEGPTLASFRRKVPERSST
ncbi:MAG: amino acid adenylation domain-containing protein [Xanthobacteraceae bacterium]|nr:amino acid adenylation domain-containing protein [Xanthobacteraceae bacterium]